MSSDSTGTLVLVASFPVSSWGYVRGRGGVCEGINTGIWPWAEENWLEALHLLATVGDRRSSGPVTTPSLHTLPAEMLGRSSWARLGLSAREEEGPSPQERVIWASKNWLTPGAVAGCDVSGPCSIFSLARCPIFSSKTKLVSSSALFPQPCCHMATAFTARPALGSRRQSSRAATALKKCTPAWRLWPTAGSGRECSRLSTALRFRGKREELGFKAGICDGMSGLQ